MLVHAITHHPFKLGSINLDQRCKRPLWRSILFCGMIDCDLQGQIDLQSQNLPHFELVHAITHHQFKLQFTNFEQNCILALFRSLPFLAWLKLIFNSFFNFKPRPNWAFYVHHWHSLVRHTGLKVGRTERIRREWTNSKNSHWNSSLAWTVSQCECFMVGSYWVCQWKKTFWAGFCDGIGGLAYLLFIPPETKFRWGILDSPCSSVHLSVCLSVCPSVCPSVGRCPDDNSNSFQWI